MKLSISTLLVLAQLGDPAARWALGGYSFDPDVYFGFTSKLCAAEEIPLDIFVQSID